MDKVFVVQVLDYANFSRRMAVKAFADRTEAEKWGNNFADELARIDRIKGEDECVINYQYEIDCVDFVE